MLNKRQIFDRLNLLTSSYSFIKVLAAICYRDFCGTIDQLASNNVFEHLNYNEFFFLMGLWVKNVEIGQELSDGEINIVIAEIYELMDTLHVCLFQDTPKINFDGNMQTMPEIFNNGASIKETIFYDGTGGYDYQYLKWLPEKYHFDDNWLLQNRNFNIKHTFDFFDLIHKKLQFKLNNSLIAKKNKFDLNSLLDAFCLSENELYGKNGIYKPLVENLMLDLKSNTNNLDFRDIGDFSIFSERPLLKLPNGKFFIPTPFSISMALYESPFYWMNLDKEYSKIALRNRGRAAEDITFKIVKSIFNDKNVYKDMRIYENRTKTKTDIDVLALHENSTIIFQVKSKKLTALSKKGDIISINNDFKKAILEAYEQGLISKECILNNERYKFLLPDGSEFLFQKDVRNCYIITIVLDDYPAITHQTNIFIGEVFDDTPVAVNIFDLEVLARYLSSPEKFIEYISKRVQFSKYYKAAGELTFLGFFLKKGLNQPNENDMIMLDESWAQSIDAMYYPEVANLKKVDFTGKLKLGRNEICYCGSNLKYKNCHGKGLS